MRAHGLGAGSISDGELKSAVLGNGRRLVALTMRSSDAAMVVGLLAPMCAQKKVPRVG